MSNLETSTTVLITLDCLRRKGKGEGRVLVVFCEVWSILCQVPACCLDPGLFAAGPDICQEVGGEYGGTLGDTIKPVIRYQVSPSPAVLSKHGNNAA